MLQIWKSSSAYDPVRGAVWFSAWAHPGEEWEDIATSPLLVLCIHMSNLLSEFPAVHAGSCGSFACVGSYLSSLVGWCMCRQGCDCTTAPPWIHSWFPTVEFLGQKFFHFLKMKFTKKHVDRKSSIQKLREVKMKHASATMTHPFVLWESLIICVYAIFSKSTQIMIMTYCLCFALIPLPCIEKSYNYISLAWKNIDTKWMNIILLFISPCMLREPYT